MSTALPVADVTSASAIVVCLAALGLIALLPRIFFRPGRLNASWWLTATPFAVAGGTLGAGLLGLLTPAAPGTTAVVGMAVASIGLAAAAVGLIVYTLRSHSRPVSLWHQQDDRPERLVTTGAYGRVRHPFYAAFLLTLLACALAFPHALTAVALVAGLVQLNRTAAREEARLRREFGPEYVGYVARTGRFLPNGMRRTLGDRAPLGRARTMIVLPMMVVAAAAEPATAQQPSSLSADPEQCGSCPGMGDDLSDA